MPLLCDCFKKNKDRKDSITIKKEPVIDPPKPRNTNTYNSRINMGQYKAMVLALYDFNSTDPSDLPFKTGDILMLKEEYSEETQGWNFAFNFRTLKTGNIPMNYVTNENYSVACNAWYNISRTEAERKLFLPGVEDGMFILRPSSDLYCLGLSVKSSCDGVLDIKHYKVHFLPTEGKFYIRHDVQFTTLDDLINFYRITELTPSGCLTTPRPKVVPPPFNFEEFKVDRSLVQLKIQLGRGNFGEVYLANMRSVTVAVKTCLPTATTEDFLNEAKNMFLLNHPRLVRFLGYCNEPADEPFYLITEYMKNGSLKDFLSSADRTRINYTKCLQIIHQVCVAMAFLEEVQVVHRDLRAANVLVDKDENVKVADFGLTKILRKNANEDQGNLTFPVRWTAPEAMMPDYVPSLKADVWSFGILAYEVLTYGKTPYEGAQR
uniref:Tyrosine-protein kinase n=1 Tax=Schistocephalus solidus TaxID=70667 RepID=A0A0X3NHE5_SCHSO